MWESNGPVYSPDCIKILEKKYCETILTCLFLLKIARENFTPSNYIRKLLRDKNIFSEPVLQSTIIYLF